MRAPRGRAARIALLVALLVVGIQFWLLSDFWLYRPLWRVAIYAAGLAICFLAPVQMLRDWLDVALASGRPWRTFGVLAAIVTASIGALYATALASGRQFTPIFHDEFAYLLQARMFASGHLWLPAHPLADFFETFYVITDRAYASQYFPGAALMFAPGAVLGLPEWAMPIVVAGCACAAMFLLMRELFGGGVGVASVVLLVGVLSFRVVSITAISQVPAMLTAMVAFFALTRWGRARSLRWVAVAGFALGWLAVTRPLEGAICGTLGAIFVALRLHEATWVGWRKVALAGLLPLVPFIALQLALNRGITGRWLQTPFGYYAARDMPGTALGFHGYDPTVRPVSTLPQKQAFFDSAVTDAVRDHTLAKEYGGWPRRQFFLAVSDAFPDMLLVIVVPAALLGLADPRRRLVALVMPLWCATYTLYVFAFTHYYVFYAASMFVVIFAGFDGLASCLRGRAARAIRTAQVIMPIVISVMAMPQFKRDVRDQWFASPGEIALERATRKIAEPRAIVMIRYSAGLSAEEELVYNIDVAWPDEARSIRAHDLGDDRNIELYRYYARRQPERAVYLFDRRDFSMVRLGTVVELASRVDASATRPTIERASLQ